MAADEYARGDEAEFPDLARAHRCPGHHEVRFNPGRLPHGPVRREQGRANANEEAGNERRRRQGERLDRGFEVQIVYRRRNDRE